MKEYFFSIEELNLIKYLKSNSPKKIWWEPIFYIFEYDHYYFRLEIVRAEKVVLTPEFEQYAMSVTIKKVNRNYRPSEIAELLIENEIIENVEVVRTCLFFCPRIPLNKSSNYYDLPSDQINPDYELPKTLKVKRMVIADVGLRIELNKRIVNCFIIENEDDFDKNLNISTNETLKNEGSAKYKFIGV